VAEVVFAVGGAVGDAHREIGHRRGDQVQAGVSGFCQDAQRVGQQPDREFETRQADGGDDRVECCSTLFFLCH
jgi:hypothetical protein